MSTPAPNSKVDKLQQKREARRQKILAAGNDRLAQITGLYSGESSVNASSESVEVATKDGPSVKTANDNAGPSATPRNRVFDRIAQSPSVVRTPQKANLDDASNLPADTPHALAESFLAGIPNIDASMLAGMKDVTADAVEEPGTAQTSRLFGVLHVVLMAFLAIVGIASMLSQTDSGVIDEEFDVDYADIGDLWIARYIDTPWIASLRKVKGMAYGSTAYSMRVPVMGYDVSIWMLFLTIELILITLRTQTQARGSTAVIPEDIKMMATAAGMQASTISNISNALDTSNAYRHIITGLMNDVLVFIFVVGTTVMVADLLV